MKKFAIKRVIVGSAAAAAIAVPLALGAGPASAATVGPGPSGTTVWLNHDETVAAAHSGVIGVLDNPTINPHTKVRVLNDSRYVKSIRTVNGVQTVGANKQQLLDEAASKSNGQVGIHVSTDPNNIVEMDPYWPAAHTRR